MSERCLVVDAESLLRKGYESVPDDRNAPDGSPVGALFAAIRALRRGIAFKEPEVAVAVMAPKNDSDTRPPRLVAQHGRFGDLLRAHGIHVVVADRPTDVVAAYTRAALGTGRDVVIVGSDKRLAQLVGDGVWWYDAYKDVRYTPELVRKRFEVDPDHVAEWLALVGDDDTLPGVKGIGKKGATTLIEEFGSVDDALAQLDALEGRAGKALRAAPDDARRELARARLDSTATLPEPIDALSYEAPDVAALSELYVSLGFFELLEAEGGLDTIEVEVCETDEAITAALAALEGPVSLHVLTEDPTPIDGALAGIALSSEGARSVYVPLSKREDVPASLCALLEDATRDKVGHDLSVATVALRGRGVTLAGIVGDSACASHLHEPSNWAPHDLTVVAKRVLHRALVDEDAVRGVGRGRKSWAKLPVERAARYAAQMAVAAGEAWRALEPTTDRALLDEYLALSETVVGMELLGIAVDGDDLARAGEDFDGFLEALETEIFELAGEKLNLGSTKQLGAVLFEKLKLPIVKRTKTGWSTATEALERIENAHPVVPLVIRWRLLRRLKDTWITSLRESIGGDGRVHAMFHPARSFSGRLVNSSPDLGRVPGKTPEMARIRHAFVAPDGMKLVSVDYEQLGLFVLAHLTNDPALTEPLAASDDLHTLTAAAVLEIDVSAVGKDERQTGKVVNFATFAGQGASALALQLGIDVAEAKELIARFDRRYAVVRAFQDEQFRLARERGFVETLAGRRWPIGDLRSRDAQIRSYAERLARRATHEGSVADVSRRGLLRADQALRARGLRAAPLLQIHDEVLFEVPDDEVETAAEVAAEAMRNAFPLRVPLRVGKIAGPNWSELTALR
jgi:DNA polymerase-1